MALLFALAGRARAEPPNPFVTYARALQRFNPSLGDDAALELAAVTIEDADREAVDARLLVAVIATESSWNPGARSKVGAIGLGQLMPQTAVGLGVDAADPLQNIAGAAHQLRLLLDRFRHRSGRYALALASYNAGAGAVLRYGGVPPYPETRDYVVRVMRLWRRLAGW